MKEFIIKHKHKLIFMLIMAIALGVRLYRWPTGITQLNCDEAMTAVNAMAMAEKGTDMYGTTGPVYLKAWKVGGQSVALFYLTAFFMKIFGVSMFTIRLPILLVSIIALFVFYDLLKRIFKSKNIALVGLGFLAICPWHILQSIWAIDCNMFPHVMLFAVYLLYRGITDKKWCLYVSMLFFGFCMYSYGVSIYVIPLFLLVTAIYLIRKKKVTIKELIPCILIYILISLPIFTMYCLNFFKIQQDIHIGPMTIQFFEGNIRKDDMIFFAENVGKTFMSNIKDLGKTVVWGYDGLEWNATPYFGTLYHGSLIIFFIGIIVLIKEILGSKKQDETEVKTEQSFDKIGIVIMAFWLMFSLILGIIVNSNVNRLNCIWYPIIFFIILGMSRIMKNKKVYYIVCALYIVAFVAFSNYLYGVHTNNIDMSSCFAKKYMDAVYAAGDVSKKEEKQMYYYDQRMDMSMWLYNTVTTKIDNTKIEQINSANTAVEKLTKENSILVLHKKYINENWLFNILDISNYHQEMFGEYVVLYSE